MEIVMTDIEIDPEVVREIAAVAIRRTSNSNRNESRDEAVEAALINSRVATPVLSKRFDAYTAAVAAEYDRLTGAQGKAFMTGDFYAHILDFVENLPAEGDAIVGYMRNGKQYKLTAADLRGLLDDYSAAVQSMVQIENIVTAFDERSE